MTRKRTTTSRVASSRVVDDFKIIRGIGPLYEKHLHAAGIDTFAQLAKLSPEDIATHIPNLSASQIRKQGWILQARKLTSNKTESKPRKKKIAVSETSQHYENFTLEFLLNEKNKLRRLRIMHVQSGDVETWADWNPEELSGFLTRHTGARLVQAKPITPVTIPPEPVVVPAQPIAKPDTDSEKADFSLPIKTESISPTPPETPAPQLQPIPTIPKSTIIPIRLLEWANLPANSDQPVNSLPHDQNFDVKLTLDITKASLPMNTQLDITGKLFAKKMGGGTRQAIGEIQRLIPSTPIIDLTIDSATLTQGLYRLEALIELNPAEAIKSANSKIDASFQGGLFQVY